MSKEVAERCCEKFEQGEIKEIKARQLYTKYKQFCMKKSIKAITENAFGRTARKRLDNKKTDKGRIYYNKPVINPSEPVINPSSQSVINPSSEQEIIKTADGKFNLPRWMVEEYDEI